ncbi:Odorant receptor [Operophtera brumata]|uniref:Odorant receptor n=1 Tax=Operophtera brumata TaxID=104452 RepID=A0A0L7L3J5_OPEBR|nr:Odorant receptor [Operophtera brumata]
MDLSSQNLEKVLDSFRLGAEDTIVQKVLNCSNDLTKNKEFTSKYLKRLGNLIEQHDLILAYTMELRAILSGPLLGQLVASGTLICFVGYQATTTIVENIIKCLMSLFYLGYNMFGLYIICRWCEEITIQSRNIGEAVYSSGWETGLSTLPGVRSTIIMVIARANKPLVFSAGGINENSPIYSLNGADCH